MLYSRIILVVIGIGCSPLSVASAQARLSVHDEWKALGAFLDNLDMVPSASPSYHVLEFGFSRVYMKLQKLQEHCRASIDDLPSKPPSGAQLSTEKLSCGVMLPDLNELSFSCDALVKLGSLRNQGEVMGSIQNFLSSVSFELSKICKPYQARFSRADKLLSKESQVSHFSRLKTIIRINL